MYWRQSEKALSSSWGVDWSFKIRKGFSKVEVAFSLSVQVAARRVRPFKSSQSPFLKEL